MVLAVALGVASWGWTFIYEIAKPFLKVSGLSYSVAGFWILSAIFLSYIIRKPGVAIIASIVAAFVESLLTHWGLMSVLWGFVQGFGAEIIFLIFAYRKWDFKVVALACTLSTILSYTLDYFMYDYKSLATQFILIQIISFIISSVLLAGVVSIKLSKRLQKLGLLDQFLISKE